MLMHKKKADAEEKVQAIQLICDTTYEIRELLHSIEINITLLHEILSKAEPFIFAGKKVLSFNTPEQEALCEILNSLQVINIKTIKK